jgi:hypothetical protein
MPSDVFWTGLFTFGGGVVGGATGYVTARLQQSLHLQRLGLERRKLEYEVDASATDEKAKRIEAKRSIYLQFLSAIDGVLNPVEYGELDQAELNKRFDRFTDAHCEIELVGDADVNRLAYDFTSVVEQIVIEASRSLEARQIHRMADSVRGRADSLRAARRKLVAQMRDDLDGVRVDPT